MIIKLILIFSSILYTACERKKENIDQYISKILTAEQAKEQTLKKRIEKQEEKNKEAINKILNSIPDSIDVGNCYTNDFSDYVEYKVVKKYFIDLGYKVRIRHMYGDKDYPLGVVVKWCD